jgi:hypothetical protein
MYIILCTALYRKEIEEEQPGRHAPFTERRAQVKI